MVDAVSTVVNDVSQNLRNKQAVQTVAPPTEKETAERYRALNRATEKLADGAERRIQEDVRASRDAARLQNNPTPPAGAGGGYQIERTSTGRAVDVVIPREEADRLQVSNLSDETERALIESTQDAELQYDQENVIRLETSANDNRIQAYQETAQRQVGQPSYRPDVRARQDELGYLRQAGGQVDTRV